MTRISKIITGLGFFNAAARRAEEKPPVKPRINMLGGIYCDIQDTLFTINDQNLELARRLYRLNELGQNIVLMSTNELGSFATIFALSDFDKTLFGPSGRISETPNMSFQHKSRLSAQLKRDPSLRLEMVIDDNDTYRDWGTYSFHPQDPVLYEFLDARISALELLRQNAPQDAAPMAHDKL